MSWFGHGAAELEAVLALPRVEALASVTSTMDVAHELAASGAAAGTLVLAEEQRGGRGRGGKRWTSPPRGGIWATLIERPRGADGLGVLSLRVGLRLAAVLERWTTSTIQLKWPNDLFVSGRKLAGILIEVRWREQRPDWVAIGLGVNVAVPAGEVAAALVATDLREVLAEIIPAVRAAATATGALTDAELAAFAARDLTAGLPVSAPGAGTARGITPDGALLIESTGGLTEWRTGSLVLADAAADRFADTH